MSNIAVLVSKYQNWQSVNHYSIYNAKNIRYYLYVFIRFLNECNIHRIEDITHEVIKDYQEDLAFRISRYGTLWKVGSQNNAIGTLKSFLKWLVREDYLVSDPSVRIEYAKEPEVLPRNILAESEIIKLLAQPDTHTVIGYRDRVILEILYSTGIRKAELENLKLTDVDYTDGYLRIDQGKGKKDRVVPLGKIACETIRNYILAVRSEIPKGKYRNHDSGFLFINQRGNKLHHDTVWQIVKRYAKQAGIKKKVTPHSLRHTCATHMLKNGAHIRHIQEMLGHSSITTTQRYTRVTIDDLKKTHAQCHPREKKYQ
ncbi:MAG: tyrosine-type recombinase/integrase [Thermoplasmata archaeon]|nr:MAG: tyrosine-type recombinase/integrase [Thermoplasmata archaeon]